MRKAARLFSVFILFSLVFSNFVIAEERRFYMIQAKDRAAKDKLLTLGVAIEAVIAEGVGVWVNEEELARLKSNGFSLLEEVSIGLDQFPDPDQSYHTYEELTQELGELAQAHDKIAALQSIGDSIEGRRLWAMHINSDPNAQENMQSEKPGIVFVGDHHAREHLSVEIPFLFAKYLLDNKNDSTISSLISERDIWIIPMLNPDGAEYDISGGRYKMWRKNRRKNPGGSMGVDLNRNYPHAWGGSGSSGREGSDIYRGPESLSEPETKAFYDFLAKRNNITVVISYHTFGEMVLYPWGHKYDQISDPRDLKVFQTMTQFMASETGYRAMKGTDLYPASGTTMDTVYGDFGKFGITFELSPRRLGDGGFYPGDIIQRVFRQNLSSCVYALKHSGDPYAVIANQ